MHILLLVAFILRTLYYVDKYKINVESIALYTVSVCVSYISFCIMLNNIFCLILVFTCVMYDSNKQIYFHPKNIFITKEANTIYYCNDACRYAIFVDSTFYM